jgi:hypothetical protein
MLCRFPSPRALTRPARWLPVVAALLGTSCSGGLNPVEGTVLYNGQPARGAVVAFHPKDDNSLTARRPTGVVGNDGTFTLSTLKPGDGAAAGEYVVTVIWPEEAGPAKPTMNMAPPPEPPDRLKGRYADRRQSGLSAAVKPGRNRLPPFELK